MEQVVRIREVYPDGTALAVHRRQSACSGDCHQCSGCGAAQETMLLRVDNPIGAAPGDLVTITGETAPVLRAAAVLGHSGALWGGAAVILSICLNFAYDRRVAKPKTILYTVTAFAGENRKKTEEKGDQNG